MHYKKGDKVRVIKKSYGHGFEIGEIVEIIEISSHVLPAYRCRNTKGNPVGNPVKVWNVWDNELEPLIKDFSTIDTGDVIVIGGEEIRVLGRAGEVIFIEEDGVGRIYSEKELKYRGFTIKQPSTEPLELSVEEISKRLGYEVKIIKK